MSRTRSTSTCRPILEAIEEEVFIKLLHSNIGNHMAVDQSPETESTANSQVLIEKKWQSCICPHESVIRVGKGGDRDNMKQGF